MDECAGEIAARLYVYDNRSCEHVSTHPTSDSQKIPAGSSRRTSLSPGSNARVSSMLLTGLVKIAHTS
jgi:hypothetical protein